VTLPPIEKRMADLLTLTAYEIRPCKACGERLFFVRHNTGKVAPYTIEGINHFVNCPQADRFKRQQA
jgi:hypothetical protein